MWNEAFYGVTSVLQVQPHNYLCSHSIIGSWAMFAFHSQTTRTFVDTYISWVRWSGRCNGGHYHTDRAKRRDKPQWKPAFQYNLWPTSQARLGLIGSLVPYVTYNLCSACTAGREGQWSPWAKVAMGTTSGCSTLLLACLTHLKAERPTISLFQARLLLLYFLMFSPCTFTGVASVPPPIIDADM